MVKFFFNLSNLVNFDVQHLFAITKRIVSGENLYCTFVFLGFIIESKGSFKFWGGFWQVRQAHQPKPGFSGFRLPPSFDAASCLRTGFARPYNPCHILKQNIFCANKIHFHKTPPFQILNQFSPGLTLQDKFKFRQLSSPAKTIPIF